ncbi:hypothetical protein JJQ59_27740 [Cupriavidus necator]|uniref:Uncharacterized protein n=1 Tax=Cupriavidus necator TaxID=106590 RepID=A0A367PSE6_CUPNE|nr:hypothetical protein [Cupriavidus necator]QQX86569.1 hypothetical protein JJQ59_27740 [Cupriavidus necator]RCJ10017.1 hypothetical protein DDK22_02070 [Cupriavidus necator]
MGQAKNEQIRAEEKVLQAISLCVEVGAISECEIHEGEYSDTLEFLDPEELVQEILKHKPESIQLFDNRADMLECVTDAMASTGEECGFCANNRDS